MAKYRVAVLGAGIVGLLSALETQARGHQVILVNPETPGGEAAASYGNGAWLNPGAVMPMSVPGLWKKIPGFLIDPTSPFIIRWRYLPGLLPWLMRFLKAGSSWQKVNDCAAQRIRLSAPTVELHRHWANEAGVAELVQQSGLIYVYHDRAQYLSEPREWQLRQTYGIAFSELERDELQRLEPQLSEDYRFGARIDHGAIIRDTGQYCAALGALLVKRGGILMLDRAIGFDIRAGRLQQVHLQGQSIACDRAVIAAGAWSAPLARAAGDRVPLISERGYHITLPEVTDLPQTGLMPFDGKMAVTPTLRGLRIAGQVELAALDTPPDWKRADILLGFARRMFPGRIGEKPDLKYWLGHRPSTPDGLPSIGPASACGDIIHGFGHGHSGLCQAPVSAKLIADLIDGTTPAFDPAPFAPQRFR